MIEKDYKYFGNDRIDALIQNNLKKNNNCDKPKLIRTDTNVK